MLLIAAWRVMRGCVPRFKALCAADHPHRPKVGAAHIGRYADSAFSSRRTNPQPLSFLTCQFYHFPQLQPDVPAGKLLRMTADTLRDTDQPLARAARSWSGPRRS